MNRLLRILLDSATTVSLVLCAATLVLWVRSYWIGDYYYAQRPDGRVGCQSERGTLFVFRKWEATVLSPEFPMYYQKELSGPAPSDSLGKDDPGRIKDWRFAGIRFYTSRGGWIGESYEGSSWRITSQPMWALGLPYWCPTLLLMLAPARWIWKWRRRRRFPEGLCPACGYDLRASAARCPECGAVASSSTPQPNGPADGAG